MAAGLADVSRFTVTKDVIAATIEVLAEAGRRGYEAFVLWGAVPRPDGSMHICSAVRPAQHAQKTRDGLLVTVAGEALFSVNKLLYERGETLAGQVHSHPGRAFHSTTDDAFPLVTLRGALSVVVPNFARARRAGTRGWVWYRLVGVGDWVQVDPADLVEVVE
jgi:hypothetical protein